MVRKVVPKRPSKSEGEEGFSLLDLKDDAVPKPKTLLGQAFGIVGWKRTVLSLGIILLKEFIANWLQRKR